MWSHANPRYIDSDAHKIRDSANNTKTKENNLCTISVRIMNVESRTNKLNIISGDGNETGKVLEDQAVFSHSSPALHQAIP